MLILYFEPQNYGECGALVVEHQTPSLEVLGSIPTRGALSKTH